MPCLICGCWLGKKCHVLPISRPRASPWPFDFVLCTAKCLQETSRAPGIRCASVLRANLRSQVAYMQTLLPECRNVIVQFPWHNFQTVHWVEELRLRVEEMQIVHVTTEGGVHADRWGIIS